MEVVAQGAGGNLLTVGPLRRLLLLLLRRCLLRGEDDRHQSECATPNPPCAQRSLAQAPPLWACVPVPPNGSLLVATD